MPKSSPAVTAPWWWPAVEADAAPRITALAEDLGLTAEATSRRVWAVFRLMMNPRLATGPLEPLFPEVDLAAGKPWDQRKIFSLALRDSREASIAHAALERLCAYVRQGTIPALPAPRAELQLTGDWRAVFSRSRRGRDNFFVRGTHRSHAGLESGRTSYEHPCFKAVLDICDRYDLVRTSFWTGSPASASTYENYAAFLDGGLKSVAGDYIGVHGAWVIGHAAMQFVSLELGVTPPPWPAALETAPSHTDLVRDLLLQLASDLPALNCRLKEFGAW